MSLLRLIASWLYGLGVGIRNFLYEEKLLRSVSVTIPTICVGNLAVGGTGKTPHTEYIARALSQQFKIAILSRGYKRKTKGFVLADENSTALTIGDEPMQMHLNLPDVIVAVSEDRVSGIHRLQQLYPDLQAVILDDAYQHRHLRCGFYLLLTAADNLYVKDHLLPRGRLREHTVGSLRANAIVVTKCPDSLKPIDKRIIEISLHAPSYQSVFFSSLRYEDVASDLQHPLLLTGIADHAPLAEHLKTIYKDIQELHFPDHHSFTAKDFERIRTMLTSSDGIITTQKDYVRLLASPLFTDDLQAITHVIKVQPDFGEQTQPFINKIIHYVKENNRNR